MKRCTGNLVALAVGLIASLGLAEIAARLAGLEFPSFYTVDSARGYGLRPGARGLWTREGKGRVSINKDGFRGPERSRQRSNTSLRVAVLGDSFTEALQVDEELTWLAQLERTLGSPRQCSLVDEYGHDVEVINFGVGGYGTLQSLLTWRNLAKTYKPDVVILLVYPGNDFKDNEPRDRNDRPVARLTPERELLIDNSFRHSVGYRWRTSFPGQIFEKLINHSRLLQLLNETKNRIANKPSSPRSHSLSHPPSVTPPASDLAWELTAKMISELNRDVESEGARLVVISANTPDQVWPRPAQRPPNPFSQEKRLKEILEAKSIPYLPLGPVLQRRSDHLGLVLHGFKDQALGEGHWNVHGHRLASQAISPWLCRL